MSERRTKNLVTVVIGGEEYKLRAEAPPEYTRECAAYVDETLLEVLRQRSLVEGHKAAILAALSLTDQLFQARAELERLRGEIAGYGARLAADVQAAMLPEDLASGR